MKTIGLNGHVIRDTRTVLLTTGDSSRHVCFCCSLTGSLQDPIAHSTLRLSVCVKIDDVW